MGTIYEDEIGGVEQQFGIAQAWHGQTQLMAGPFTWFDLELLDARITWPQITVPLADIVVDGVTTLPDAQASVRVRPDGTRDLFGVFSDVYKAHGAKLLYDICDAAAPEHGMVSALTLHHGRQCAMTWEEAPVEINGVVFHAHMLASTSADGSLASTVRETRTPAVCMNTLALGLRGLLAYRFKHTTNSVDAMEEAARVRKHGDEQGEAFIEQIKALQGLSVSHNQFADITYALFPIVDDAKKVKANNASRDARTKVMAVWEDGSMAEGHELSGWAALQAVNTFENWFAPVRKTKGLDEKTTRFLRQFDAQVSGTQPLTQKTLSLLGV
jgi:hypothetical protein